MKVIIFLIFLFFLIYLFLSKFQTKYIKKSFNCNISNDKGYSNTYSNTYSLFYNIFFYEENKYKWEASKVLQYIPKGELLDVCCGTGIHYSLLKENLSILGIDKSKSMIDRALERNPDGYFINKDINNFVSFKKFDGITAFYDGIFYNKNWKDIIKKLILLLKKDGLLFISFLNKDKLENYYLRMVYNNTILYYYGEWDQSNYNEKITNIIGNTIYKNTHQLYLPDEKEFLEEMKSLTLIEKIRYDVFDAKSEVLYIFKL